MTVFEAREGWGGCLREHSEFEKFDEDIKLQFSAVSVEFKFGKEIKSLDELDGFDAIYIATGQDGSSFGLSDSWDSEMLITSNPKVFMGGGLCGASPMEAIAQGNELSKTIETFLQTGNVIKSPGGYDKSYCGRYLDHEDARSVPLVKAASADGYSEQEAKQEAQRCLKCDCEKCMRSCEMLALFRKKPTGWPLRYLQINRGHCQAALEERPIPATFAGTANQFVPSVDLGEVALPGRRMNAGTHPAALHDFGSEDGLFHRRGGSGLFRTIDTSSSRCQLGASNPEHVWRI